MPNSVKQANFLIIISALFPFVNSYYFGYEYSDSFEIPYVLFSIDILWLLFIYWIVLRIKKGSDWRFGVLAIGIVSLGYCAVDIYEYGLMKSQIPDALEAVSLFVAWGLLRVEQSSNWFLNKNKV